MPYNPNRHHRRSIRLKGYDYSTAGAYFVTICIHQRRSLLGEIRNGFMCPNAVGEMVQTIWDNLPTYSPGLELDAFVLMPNHIHGILVLTDERTDSRRNESSTSTLGNIIHRFKSFTTKEYRQGVKRLEWEPFDKKLWQRNYYEHIIRSPESLEILRQYIANNPLSWESDQLFPNISQTP